MRTVVVLGAGDLGAAIALRLAERALARCVVLVDADESRARGKALDIRQAGPVEGTDSAVEGADSLTVVGPFDALVVADPADLAGLAGAAAPGERFSAEVAGAAGQGPVVVAAAHPSSVVEAAVARGAPRDRVVGSASVAAAAALRRRLARELEVEPSTVSATVLGLPPGDLVAPQGSATAGGIPVERIAPAALRRVAAELAVRSPGPVALAAAAVRVLAALGGSRDTLLPVVVSLQGEYGVRGVALAVPARLGGGRVRGIVEVALEPVERVAMDNAARRRERRRA